MTTDTKIISHLEPNQTLLKRYPLPYLITVLLVSYGAFLVFLVAKHESFGVLITRTNTQPYLDVAAALLKWSFADLHIKVFWGTSIATALVTLVTKLQPSTALILTSILSGFVIVYLLGKLFTWQTAALAIFMSGALMKHVIFGGSEPLFLAVLLSAVLLLRRGHWVASSLVASLSCTVRPLGGMLVLAMLIVLLYRREYLLALKCAAISSLIAVSYQVFIFCATGQSTLGHVQGYSGDWTGGNPWGIPIVSILSRYLYAGSMLLAIKCGVWMALTLLCIVRTAGRLKYERQGSTGVAESWFVIGFALFHLSYNPQVPDFPRLICPLTPWLAETVQSVIPLNKYATILAAGVFGVLTGMSFS